MPQPKEEYFYELCKKYESDKDKFTMCVCVEKIKDLNKRVTKLEEIMLKEQKQQ